jgi:lipoyl(octanoyl) transferase
MDFDVVDLGLLSWEAAYARQLQVLAEKENNENRRDVLFLVEHPPVFTLGKRGGRGFFRLSEEEMLARGVGILETGRGGLVTFHGPGQLVAYPVFSIVRRGLGVRDWVRLLERIMERCAKAFGLEAGGREGAPGLWVEGRKLASIGISLRHGVSLHGLALNVSLDLTPFSWIAPCGMDIAMTSFERELGAAPLMAVVKGVLVESFAALCSLKGEGVAGAGLPWIV